MLQLDIAGVMHREKAFTITRKRKAEFGQFMTPASMARFMASLFPPSSLQTCRLLDAGAGMGALSCAFLDRWLTGGFGFASLEATAYETDDHLRGHLARHMARYGRATSRIIAGDYIQLATAHGLRNRGYTHVILNPPYKKISSHSAHRLALRRVGIETVSLFRLERGGQQGPVTVSISTDDSFADFATHEHPFERIVLPDVPERLIQKSIVHQGSFKIVLKLVGLPCLPFLQNSVSG